MYVCVYHLIQYILMHACMHMHTGGKESRKSIIKNNDNVKPPPAKRCRGKKTGSGCRFYKSTALGNFSDLALVNLYLDIVCIEMSSHTCIYTSCIYMHAHTRNFICGIHCSV